MRIRATLWIIGISCGLALAAGTARAQEAPAPAGFSPVLPPALDTPGPAPIRVGNLVDFSGRTAMIGRLYGQGQADAVAYINAQGGIAGRRIDFLTVDYAYILPQAVAAYNGWKAGGPLVAIQGWGASDTQALKDFVTRDQVPYFSADFSAALTDPVGTPERPGTPYQFIVGPTYADALRALLQWARQDWQSKGMTVAPRYAHVGDGSDFAGLVLAAGQSYAGELGFTRVPAIGYGEADQAAAACTALKDAQVDYAYLAGTRDVNVPLVTACRKMGVTTRFMTNIWGFDERFMELAGTAADGMVWVMPTAPWGSAAPGQKTLDAISAMSAPGGQPVARPVQYIQGVCAVYFMKDAIGRAAGMQGGITGPNVKAAMYGAENWAPQGLDGICNPATWRPQDHRSVTNVWVYMSHVAPGGNSIERVYQAPVPRRPEWLGQ